ncbi:hypothetical protein DASC09_043730 [Saccharomycopsis crataegensis]|uniref:Uncharacterized protein n=1 Tax=Saccharomycopsis crataegensis TaxID=43959 RepID=A0AAV5QSC9_9ASCO|nr:hypothetical protein DASC09_043730 [Saccharomycopsis crataegensis]
MTLTWFITGASSGLGLALAKTALAKGDKVIGTSRESSRLAEIVSQGAIPLTFNSSDSPQVINSIISDVFKKHGPIDVVVNNAGYGEIGIFEEIDYPTIENQYQVNVFAPIKVLQGFLPYLRSQKSGLIINVGSVAAFGSDPISGIYGSTKAAIKKLSASIDSEVKEFGIRVIVVEPGPFRTPIVKNYSEQGVFKDRSTIKDYDESRKMVDMFFSHINQASGDPNRFGKALVKLAHREEEFKESIPCVLALGEYTYERKNGVFADELEEMKKYKNVTFSTDNPDM